MTKTKDTLLDAADSIKPYLERAMTDEKLRDEVMRAFGTARELYGELVERQGPARSRSPSRVATDDEIRDKLREAIEDLRRASEPDPGQGEGAHIGSRRKAADRRHRARDPLQPGDRLGDATLHQGSRLIGGTTTTTRRAARTAGADEAFSHAGSRRPASLTR